MNLADMTPVRSLMWKNGSVMDLYRSEDDKVFVAKWIKGHPMGKQHWLVYSSPEFNVVMFESNAMSLLDLERGGKSFHYGPLNALIPIGQLSAQQHFEYTGTVHYAIFPPPEEDEVPAKKAVAAAVEQTVIDGEYEVTLYVNEDGDGSCNVRLLPYEGLLFSASLEHLNYAGTLEDGDAEHEVPMLTKFKIIDWAKMEGYVLEY